MLSGIIQIKYSVWFGLRMYLWNVFANYSWFMSRFLLVWFCLANPKLIIDFKSIDEFGLTDSEPKHWQMDLIELFENCLILYKMNSVPTQHKDSFWCLLVNIQ